MAWSERRSRPGRWCEFVVVIVAGSNQSIADRGRSYTAMELDKAEARCVELRAVGVAASVCRLVAEKGP